MARRKATGEIRWKGKLATSRIRTFGERETFELPHARTDEDARERSALLADVAKRFRLAAVDRVQAAEALRLIAGASPKALRASLTVAEELLGSGRLDAGTDAPTFQNVAEQWTSGELARLYPDQVKKKRTKGDDVSRLTNYVYPVIGDTPIDRVTLDQCEDVMRNLPAKLTPATRRNIARTVARVFKLAIYPLRHIEKSPIPEGFVPKAKQSKALAYLYPDEERRLLGCRAVPVEYRVLWGFLAREGMREDEALSLAIRDLDLARGAVKLDRNKTDDPRAWALSPDVVRALRLFIETHREGAEPQELVFCDEHGRPVQHAHLAARFRRHLEATGLKKERPELFTTTEHRLRIRVHDLRGTFVTVSLANGRTESWISDRTGHRSSAMIAKYKRMARTFEELGAGPLGLLNEAIPELAIAGIVAGLRALTGRVIAPVLPQDSRRGWDSNPRVTVLQTVA
jgi:integrase